MSMCVIIRIQSKLSWKSYRVIAVYMLLHVFLFMVINTIQIYSAHSNFKIIYLMIHCVSATNVYQVNSLSSSWIDRLVQERRNSITNALELRLSCTNLSKWWTISMRCCKTGTVRLYFSTRILNFMNGTNPVCCNSVPACYVATHFGTAAVICAKFCNNHFIIICNSKPKLYANLNCDWWIISEMSCSQ